VIESGTFVNRWANIYATLWVVDMDVEVDAAAVALVSPLSPPLPSLSHARTALPSRSHSADIAVDYRDRYDSCMQIAACASYANVQMWTLSCQATSLCTAC